MAKIYMMRHGAVPANDKRVLISWTDESLSELGQAQAIHAAENLRLQGISFDRVISSPMRRAIQTAEWVAPGSQVEIDQRLREVEFGPALEGTFCPDVKDAFDSAGFSRADGESIPSLVERARSFLNWILETAQDNETILCVSHGTTIRAILAVVLELQPAQLFDLPSPSNCGYHLLQGQKETGFQVIPENVV